MLKGFQAFHGCEPPHTHDLVSLLTTCLDFDTSLDELAPACDLLTPFAVGVRYPFDAAELGEPQGRAAVLAAEQVYAALRRRLPMPAVKCHPEHGPGTVSKSPNPS